MKNAFPQLFAGGRLTVVARRVISSEIAPSVGVQY